MVKPPKRNYLIRGKNLVYNEKMRGWEDPNILEPNLKGKILCPKCRRPRIDINGVKDCDFCLQALTECDLVDYACCGHGNDEEAYISFKDGRRWILDSEYSIRDTERDKMREVIEMLKSQ